MSWKKAPDELIEAFYKNLKHFADADLRKMFGYPCSFLNNNMFTGLHEENWVVRLSEEDRSELIEQFGAKPFEPMKGRVMREYLALPKKILGDEALLQLWLRKSYQFVSALPPKLKKAKKSKVVKSR